MSSVLIYREIGAALIVTALTLLVGWSCLDRAKARQVHVHDDTCPDYDYERGRYFYGCEGES